MAEKVFLSGLLIAGLLVGVSMVLVRCGGIWESVAMVALQASIGCTVLTAVALVGCWLYLIWRG